MASNRDFYGLGEEVLELKRLIQREDRDGALVLIAEMEEMNKIYTTPSFCFYSISLKATEP